MTTLKTCPVRHQIRYCTYTSTHHTHIHSKREMQYQIKLKLTQGEKLHLTFQRPLLKQRIRKIQNTQMNNKNISSRQPMEHVFQKLSFQHQHTALVISVCSACPFYPSKCASARAPEKIEHLSANALVRLTSTLTSRHRTNNSI